MKKRIITLAAVIAVGAPVLAACGSTGDTGQTTAQTTTAAETGTTTATTTTATTTASTTTTAASGTTSAAKSDVNPYAWLGLQDMPKCNYLDIISTGHYIQVSDYHALGLTVEQTEAVDGVNTYTGNENSRTYSIDGKVTSITEASKMYMESDVSSLIEMAKENQEKAMAEGTDTSGRHFTGTGKGSIPGIDSDTAEYEYYEYDYPDGAEAGAGMTERFYMKDGDVHAIYQKVALGESEVESVKVIKSISGDIPAGTFDLPDLSGYTKY